MSISFAQDASGQYYVDSTNSPGEGWVKTTPGPRGGVRWVYRGKTPRAQEHPLASGKPEWMKSHEHPAKPAQQPQQQAPLVSDADVAKLLRQFDTIPEKEFRQIINADEATANKAFTHHSEESQRLLKGSGRSREERQAFLKAQQTASLYLWVANTRAQQRLAAKSGNAQQKTDIGGSTITIEKPKSFSVSEHAPSEHRGHASALWYNEILGDCLRQTEDVAEAILAADLAFSIQPVPPAEFGMVGDEWHGAKPPGKNWVPIGPGPRGGKRWKRGGGGGQAPEQPQQGNKIDVGGSTIEVTGGEDEGKPMPRTVQRRRKVADTAAFANAIQGRIKKGLQRSDVEEIAQQLGEMTVAEITAIKKQLGLKGSGRKAELARKLAERAVRASELELRDAPGAETPQESGPDTVDPRAPVQERLKQYARGDAKVRALAQVGKEMTHWLQENVRLEAEISGLWNKQRALKSHRLGKQDSANLRSLLEKAGTAQERFHKMRRANADFVTKNFAAQNPVDLPYEFHADPQVRENVFQARRFVAALVEGGQTFPLAIRSVDESYPRANYQVARKSVFLASHDMTGTAVHELGHHIEYHVPGVQEACREFLKYRIKGQKPRKFKEVDPGSGYLDDEEGVEDEFGKAFGMGQGWYVGKIYKHGATEILSMGLEKLHEDPTGFAEKDPEYCKFILGVLDGSLRSQTASGEIDRSDHATLPDV